jgi:hypothetical protein
VDLEGRFVDSDFLKSSLMDLILLDPALENLYYEAHVGAFAFVSNLPRELVNYSLEYTSKREELEKRSDSGDQRGLRSWLDDRYHQFWDRLQGNERARTKFIRDILVRQVEYGASVLIPPVPLIINENLFELTKTMNRKSAEVSRLVGLVGECADAFIFRVDALRNSDLMQELKEYLDKARARFTIFKFKYINLNDEDRVVERKNFKELMQTLDLKSRLDPNRSFMLLEAGGLTFACAGRGFDFVSTSFSLDREDRMRRTEKSPWGKWYDPQYQISFDRDVFLETYKNNGGRIPCDCAECVSTSRPDTLGIDDWNRFVKRHYLLRRNQDYTEIADAISDGTATAGTIDRLRDSALKNLVELVR